VNAAVLSGTGDALRTLIVVEQPRQTTEQTQLTQADGDPDALVRRGADVTMSRVSPIARPRPTTSGDSTTIPRH
jgi:hypothetical protein